MESSGFCEPRRYIVEFTYRGGATRVVPVITYLGPLKAVYLASATLRESLGRGASDVAVRDVGPVEMDERGVAKLDGHIFDRREW